VDTEKAKRAILRARKAGQDFAMEMTASLRELEEALEEVPTIRPPSQAAMEAVKVEVVKIPVPRKPR
jgi:hypothetical protein